MIVQSVEPELAGALTEAKWLGPFSVDVRYPGDISDTFPGDEGRALHLARQVMDAVMASLRTCLSPK